MIKYKKILTFLIKDLWSVKHWTGMTLAVSTTTTRLLDPYAKSPFSDLKNKLTKVINI